MRAKASERFTGSRRSCDTESVRRALLPVLALLLVTALPAAASAYDRQITFGITGGWGWAPALEILPNNGPTAGVSASIGFGDAWGVAAYGGWAVHPPFTDSSLAPVHVGLFGVEGLYFFDIISLVPIFGLGVDVLPTFNGTAWGADMAVHLRASLDYLVSREVIVGLDIRPYVLLTNLSLDPVYLTFQLRVSFVFDY